MNREEQIFSRFWCVPNCLTINGLRSWQDAFWYFTCSPFYQRLDNGKTYDPESLTDEKMILPFKIIEYKKENASNVYLILKLDDQNEKIDYAFYIYDNVIYPTSSFSGLLTYRIDSIMQNVITLFDNIDKAIQIHPIDGFSWNSEPEELKDMESLLPDDHFVLNEYNVAEAVNSFLRTNPLN